MMDHSAWLTAFTTRFNGLKDDAEKAIAQLEDVQLMQRPAEGFNSVGVIMRHVAGNLHSRFTDFLTTDGEKPDRGRETEFADWSGTRAELETYWNNGWSVLMNAIHALAEADLDRQVLIRGEPHTVPDALLRAATHTAGHVGQIVYLSRLIRTGSGGEWSWISIPPGQSDAFNQTMHIRAPAVMPLDEPT